MLNWQTVLECFTMPTLIPPRNPTLCRVHPVDRSQKLSHQFLFAASLLAALSLVLTASATTQLSAAEPVAEVKTEKVQEIKVLLVAGGCCHDYAAQTKLLKEGIEERIHADVTVVFNPEGKTSTVFEIYESDDWAQGYDVVIHDECSASVMEEAYVRRILKAHEEGVPAVNLHCAMHSYRWGDFRNPVELGAENALWYEMIGIQSTGHGPKTPIDVSFLDEHPITKGMKDWTTIDEELYNNVSVYGRATALARGTQMQLPNKKALKNNPDAKAKEATAVVVWTNAYGPKKTRIFSTSLGHQNETVADARYLDLVSRGVLWATGNMSDDGAVSDSLSKQPN